MFFVLVSQVLKTVTLSSRLISTLSHALPHPCTVTLVVPVWCVTLSHTEIWAGRSPSLKPTVTLWKTKNWQLLTRDPIGMQESVVKSCYLKPVFTRNAASLAQKQSKSPMYMYVSRREQEREKS